MKKKPLVATLLLLFFCVFLGTGTVHADVDGQINRIDNSSTTDDALKSDKQKKDAVKETAPTDDPATLYDRYKDNSFELMTKEQKGLNPFKKLTGKITGVLKSTIWSWTKGQGMLNMAMVKMMFDLDIVSPIKDQMLSFTSMIATNMLSIAGTVGIAFISMVMAIKFIGEQRFKRAVGVFCMTILIFVGLVTLKDGTTSNSFFTGLLDIDKTVETKVVGVNPLLQNRPEKSSGDVNTDLKSAGDMLASRIFYTNVYEPYLLLNYGTSSTGTIRTKKVQYSGTEYDRINILLDNDAGTDLGDKIQDKVTDFESDKLKNRKISYTWNLENALFALFYAIVNTFQTVILFILCLIRIIFAVMQLFLLPLLPILLLVGLFMTSMNPYKNFGKAFGMTVIMKAMTGFACILVTSFLSVGFQLAGQVNNVWEKLLTILVYLLAPVGIYVFRTFLGSLLTGQATLQNALGFATHPFSTQKMMRDNAKERKNENKQNAKDEKERRKKQKEAERKRALDAGNQDLRLKQPKEAKDRKQSAIRRDLKPTTKHKAPNKREQLQQNLDSLHQKSRDNEAQETRALTQKREGKARERDVQKTAEAVALANRQWQAKRRTATPTTPNSDVREGKAHAQRSTKRTQAATPSSSNTVIGVPATKRAMTANGTGAAKSIPTRKQGTSPTPRTLLKSGNARTGRSVTRDTKGAVKAPTTKPRQGQKRPVEAVNRATTTSKTPRTIQATGGTIKRRAPQVRQKMQAVQSVTQNQNKGKSLGTNIVSERQKGTMPPQKNITRTLKRQTPIKHLVSPKQAKIRRKR